VLTCLQALPACSPSTLVAMLGALSKLQLTREDLQGLRTTTAGGVPSPSDVCAALYSALLPHLPALPLDQLAAAASAIEQLEAQPPHAWATAFVRAAAAQLLRAGPAGPDGAAGQAGGRVADVVTLLGKLPSVTQALEGSGEELEARTFSYACVQRIGACVAELELPALADLMAAVGSGSLGSGAAVGDPGAGTNCTPAAFVDSVLEASEAKLAGADIGTAAHLAAAVVQVGHAAICGGCFSSHTLCF
jgi:hypothetical protein